MWTLGACKIFIELGKGSKDRYILFPEPFRLILKAHIAAKPDNRYLFESRQRTRFSARRVQQIVADYAAVAELPEHVHPHLLRHRMLTWLTAQGLPDAQIQLISGTPARRAWRFTSICRWPRWKRATSGQLSSLKYKD